MDKQLNLRKYILVFFITLGVFAIVFLFSNYLYSQRITQVKGIEANINQNILESEVQYALLAETSCDTDEVTGNNLLIGEINSLTKKLSHMEDQRGIDDPEVISLKKYYSLLQVKDYLLVRERARKCKDTPPIILYFYSNKGGECVDCQRLGYVLTSMREDYTNLHVYAFDYNLGLSVIETLKSIYKMKNEPPVLVINNKVYYGFKTRESIEGLISGLSTSTPATTATSSKK
jgi:hypothetical protein